MAYDSCDRSQRSLGLATPETATDPAVELIRTGLVSSRAGRALRPNNTAAALAPSSALTFP